MSEDNLAIVRELHGTVTHCLSSVALQVMAAEARPSIAPPEMAEIRRLTAEATSVLGLLEKLLQSADAPAPQLHMSALWVPTIVAGERQLSLTRQGAEVDLSVPVDADRLEVTLRYAVVLALDLVGEHIDRHLPSGDRSSIALNVAPTAVELNFLPRSGSQSGALPVLPPKTVDQLRARVDLVGGDVSLTTDSDEEQWQLALRLDRHD